LQPCLGWMTGDRGRQIWVCTNVRVCRCPIPGVWVSKSGFAGVRFRLYGCASPSLRVSDSGCMGVQGACRRGTAS
jgi:hypothetical protein